MRKSVQAHIRDFFTYGGEFGRDDYWKAMVIRLLLFVLLYVVLAVGGIVLLAIANPDSWLEEIASVVIPLREVWFYVYLLGGLWPILFRRWRDLKPKLSKGWLYLLLVHNFLPSFQDVEQLPLKILLIVLMIAALYPGLMLGFCGGKKYARFQQGKMNSLNDQGS